MILAFKNIEFDWQFFFKTYLQHVKPSYEVIEIGASNIIRSDNLAKFCKNLTGIELFATRLPKNHKNINYIQADWQYLSQSVPKNFFDILVSSHTIEHVPNDLEAINQSHSVLKKGGVALILTPNRLRLIRSFIEIFTGPKKFPDWEHIREYTESDLIKLINKSHFKNYKITPLLFGIHSYIGFLVLKVPPPFRKFCNCWQIELIK